jgi:hypothetical protein
MASTTILSLLLLLAADTRAPVTTPQIMAFFCNTSKEKKICEGKILSWKSKLQVDLSIE